MIVTTLPIAELEESASEWLLSSSRTPFVPQERVTLSLVGDG